jgi:hypothetical protein
MQSARQHLLAGPRLAFDEDGGGVGGTLLRPLEEALHDGALVQDVAELRRQRGEALLEAGEARVRAADDLRDELGGQLERDVSRLDAVLLGGLDELGGVLGLGDDDPDRRHRRRAGAQVEREGRRAGGRSACGRERPRDLRRDGAVDVLVMGR